MLSQYKLSNEGSRIFCQHGLFKCSFECASCNGQMGRRRQGNMPLWIHPVNECRKLAFSRIFTLFTSKMWIIHKLVCNSVITNTIQHTSWRVTLSSSCINTVQGLLYTQCAGSTLLRNDSNYLPYGIRGAHSG